MLNGARRLGFAALSSLLLGCTQASDSPPDQAGMQSSSPAGGIQGAWGVAEIRRADGLVATNPPGLYLFGGAHYSIMYANAEAPRATFANVDAPTDAELKAAYDTFIANSGSYTVIGDTLVIRPVIAKHPNYMGGGIDKFTLRMQGDTLWLRSVPGAFRWAAGPPPSPADTASDSYRLLRLR